MAEATHAFDDAIRLQCLAGDVFGGHTGRAYWNMIGPFGGISAATALNAVLQHPMLLGEPVSLTVNFAAALQDGAFTVTARAARTNRSTQHWMVELAQAGADGKPQTMLTATVLTAVRRATWNGNDTAMPVVPPPDEVAPMRGKLPIEWLNRYDARPIAGAIPRVWDDTENAAPGQQASLSSLWMRDKPPRPLDFCSLTAMADFFFPRIFLRRARRVPVGTVSMTVYFHASAALLQQSGTGFLLGQAVGQVYYDGFFDHNAVLWNEAGVPLATSSQVVYYKE